MGWGGRIGGALTVLAIGGFFYYLSTEAENDRKVRAAKQAALDAERKREDDATARLLANPVATKTEIERRLADWITAKNDVYILERQTSSGRPHILTVPRTREWSLKCVGGVLLAEFALLSGEEDDYALTLRLLPGRLDAQQCRTYLEFATDKMTAITRPR